MDQICAAATLSPGAVYRYFDSKYAIIEAIAEEERAEVAAFLRKLRDARDFVKGFIDITEALVLASIKSDDARLAVEVMAEASRSREVSRIFERHDADTLAMLTEIVRNAAARGDIDASLKPEAVGELLLALIDGIVGRTLFNPRYNARMVTRGFRLLVTRFLRPDLSPR